MDFSKAGRISLLTGVLIVGSLSQAAFSPAESQESRAPMSRASSLGEPLTMQEVIELETGPLADFETEIDAPSASENVDSWTDDQVESFYEDELRVTNELLEDVMAHPSLLKELGTYGVAASGKKSPKKSQMSAVSCLASAIHGEASGEPYAGKLAVGETVMARANGNPKKVCSVIFAKAQFESIKKRLPKANADSIRAAKATIAKGGKCGYDHFLNKKLQRKMGRKIPQWVRNFEKRKCATKTVGQHTFYSSCNCKRR